MKAYLITTGTVFTLIVVAHIARLADEGWYMLEDPWFIALTLLAAGLAVWAWRLLWRLRSLPPGKGRAPREGR